MVQLTAVSGATAKTVAPSCPLICAESSAAKLIVVPAVTPYDVPAVAWNSAVGAIETRPFVAVMETSRSPSMSTLLENDLSVRSLLTPCAETVVCPDRAVTWTSASAAVARSWTPSDPTTCTVEASRPISLVADIAIAAFAVTRTSPPAVTTASRDAELRSRSLSAPAAETVTDPSTARITAFDVPPLAGAAASTVTPSCAVSCAAPSAARLIVVPAVTP